LEKYVIGFNVYKPNETIAHTECSAGEKKTIKCFSTLLNKEYLPQVILIDNVAMHVELNRHLALVDSMRKCFPHSQIFTATHSYRISRNFGDKSQLYDMRLVRSSDLIKSQPWRLNLADEIQDALSKLNDGKEFCNHKLIARGDKLLSNCLEQGICGENKMSSENILEEAKSFFKDVVDETINDICISSESTKRR